MEFSKQEKEWIEELTPSFKKRLLRGIIGFILSGAICYYMFKMMFHELPDGTEVLTPFAIFFCVFAYTGISDLVKVFGFSPQDKLLIALAKKIEEIPEKETSQQEDG